MDKLKELFTKDIMGFPLAMFLAAGVVYMAFVAPKKNRFKF